MSSITALILGNKTFPVNMIQGPLAGVSCAPFRALTWQYSRPAFSCTEMLSCKTLIYQSKIAEARYLIRDPEEGPVCFQLSGSDPSELAEATKIVTDQGADLIDLNCGCPVNKIRSKGAGSSLLMHPSKLYQLIRSMKQSTTLPVSIKIRVEGASNDRCNAEIAKVVAEAGADFLIVHGRHWTEHYETSCRYEDIQFFVDALKIPVIGNGDIACVASLEKMLATGCAGVMIGRAGVGQPWLLGRLMAELQGQPFTLPSIVDIGKIFLRHVEKLAGLLGSEKFAILQARKFTKYYARSLAQRAAFCEAVNQCEDFGGLRKICDQYFVD